MSGGFRVLVGGAFVRLALAGDDVLDRFAQEILLIGGGFDQPVANDCQHALAEAFVDIPPWTGLLGQEAALQIGGGKPIGKRGVWQVQSQELGDPVFDCLHFIVRHAGEFLLTQSVEAAAEGGGQFLGVGSGMAGAADALFQRIE